MNQELAKRLKDAGYPQPTGLEHSLEWRGVRECKNGECVYFPTLSELIEACGEDFNALHSVVGGWRADASYKCGGDCGIIECGGYHSISEMFPTPSEAVANLWLTLHENKK